MKFSKLRISGFKSFVEPSEFLIDPGLTGIVGPNGCGKSNLVEALRWVMGENSYKNMRASEMDDVIFSGNSNRPARNHAEVSVVLDNQDRTAPAAFNGDETLEISRKIERGSGSSYRINGRDARARDVQLMFADASTGARSPAMVRQGQIGELISAKPTARRQILEEAAGISGLHARRHDAELRLRGAEQNMDRLDDLLQELDVQLEALKRQSRQAARYRSLSARIRRSEALLAWTRWQAANALLAEAIKAAKEADNAVVDASGVQASTARDQAVIAASLPDLRDNEANAAAVLQRLTLARGELDAEEQRTQSRLQELTRLIEQLQADIAREESLVADNGESLALVEAEEKDLLGGDEGSEDKKIALQKECDDYASSLKKKEERLSVIQAEQAAFHAEMAQLQRTCETDEARLKSLHKQNAAIDAEIGKLASQLKDDPRAGLEQAIATLEKAVEDASVTAEKCSEAREAARTEAKAAQQPVVEAEKRLTRLEAEAATLERFLHSGSKDLWAPLLEKVSVSTGYEAAFGAVIGDDLDAPNDQSADSFWQMPGSDDDDPALPEGAEPLLTFVEAPDLLHRRLKQIGVVDLDAGDRLKDDLKAGQRLVCKEGGVWRWDGYTHKPGAETAAAKRLEQRNRLIELKRDVDVASKELGNLQKTVARQEEASDAASQADRDARATWSAKRDELTQKQSELRTANKRLQTTLDRQSGQTGLKERTLASITETEERFAETRNKIDGRSMPHTDNAISVLQLDLSNLRNDHSRASAALEGVEREARLRDSRLAAIKRERESWAKRQNAGQEQLIQLAKRIGDAKADFEETQALPASLVQRKRALLSEIQKAETARKNEADKLAKAEAELTLADRAAREALEMLSAQREEKARSEERRNAAGEKLDALRDSISETLQSRPEQLREVADIKADEKIPSPDEVETGLERLRGERERMGPVNLRAEIEAEEMAHRRDKLTEERDDLIEAIQRLRTGISSLNSEARTRLLDAFEVVNGHFRSLFENLFGGGMAELKLVGSDDPLDAGLEIYARPPGKRLQALTLLSGGEQALTATALIFAVFLTNPAPICVLDEVDAPLDDANVERFCNLMNEMCTRTETRFVIVTHSAITMARMDRLFGVTMSERGVSQLFSVDLSEATGYLEAS